MFKHYFEQVENVAVWPIISLLIFFLFFLTLLIWVLKVDKGYIRHMRNLPVDAEEEKQQESFPPPHANHHPKNS